MSDKQAAAAEAAEFAELLSELGGDEPATGDEPDQSVDTVDRSEDAPAGDVSPDEPEAAPLEAVETEAGKLIEAGDLEAAAKKLGIDPKLFKLDKRQFAAMRKGLTEAKRKEADAGGKLKTSEKLRADAEAVYGPIAAIELMCEDSIENIVATIQRAGKPADPATAEVMRLRRELADRDAKQTQAQQAQAAELKARSDTAAIEKRLASTPLAKVPGAAREIYDRVKASFDGVGYAKTVKEAYAEVKAEKAAIAAALGAPARKPAPPTRKPLVPVRKDLAALTPMQRKAAREEQERAEFRAVLAEADEAVKAEVRRGRRAGR